MKAGRILRRARRTWLKRSQRWDSAQDFSYLHAELLRESLSELLAMVSALVPAAGMSTRVGSNKLLLPFKGKPLIAHAVDTLLASAADEIVVVLGYEAERVRA